MDAVESPDEPPVWTLAFQRQTNVAWIRWIARGPYKHVAACCYLPGLDAWLFYDVRLGYTSLSVLAGEAAKLRWCEFARDADLMTIAAAPDRRDRRPLARLGFWCVPAIKHLIGLRSSALLPTAFYRDCLAAGGQKLGRHPAIQPAGA